MEKTCADVCGFVCLRIATVATMLTNVRMIIMSCRPNSRFTLPSSLRTIRNQWANESVRIETTSTISSGTYRPLTSSVNQVASVMREMVSELAPLVSYQLPWSPTAVRCRPPGPAVPT